MNITVVVTGLDEQQARLKSMGAKFFDFSEEMEAIGEGLKTYYGNTVFSSRGEMFGGWPELKPNTLAYKESHYPGRDILVRGGKDSEHMQESFTSEVTPLSVYVTNKASYFKYHQLGTGDGKGRGHNIPRRQMIGVTPYVKTLVQTIIEAGVRTKIEAA